MSHAPRPLRAACANWRLLDELLESSVLLRVHARHMRQAQSARRRPSVSQPRRRARSKRARRHEAARSTSSSSVNLKSDLGAGKQAERRGPAHCRAYGTGGAQGARRARPRCKHTSCSEQVSTVCLLTGAVLTPLPTPPAARTSRHGRVTSRSPVSRELGRRNLPAAADNAFYASGRWGRWMTRLARRARLSRAPRVVATRGRGNAGAAARAKRRDTRRQDASHCRRTRRIDARAPT